MDFEWIGNKLMKALGKMILQGNCFQNISYFFVCYMDVTLSELGFEKIYSECDLDNSQYIIK